MTEHELLLNARLLPREEQIDFAMEIWGAGAGADASLTAEHRQELERRAAADDADPSPAEAWPALRDRLLRGEFRAVRTTV